MQGLSLHVLLFLSLAFNANISSFVSSLSKDVDRLFFSNTAINCILSDREQDVLKTLSGYECIGVKPAHKGRNMITKHTFLYEQMCDKRFKSKEWYVKSHNNLLNIKNQLFGTIAFLRWKENY